MLLAAILSLITIKLITPLESNDTPSVDFGSIQITEVDYNGYASFDSTPTTSTKEAIEITNTSNKTINVADWQLRILSGKTDKSLILPNENLAPSEVFVFIRGLDIPSNVKGLSYTGSLDNASGSFIELRDSRGVTVDSFNQFGKWSQELSEKTDSLQKISHEWKSCLSTLGQINSCASLDSQEPTEEQVNPEESIEPEIPQDITIKINEILPNPQGSDTNFEFVELYNYGEKELLLDGLVLDDILEGGSSEQSLTGILKPKSYLLIQGKDLGISLNNSGDEVNLIHKQTQTSIGTLKYTQDQVIEGKSIGELENQIHIFDIPTPGQKNQPNPQSPKNQDLTPVSPKEKASPQISFTTHKGNILINEILPNPDGKDTEGEFIELLNTTSDKVLLNGWQLRVEKKMFTFDSQIIDGEEIVSVFRPESKLTLSNSKTFTVELIAPTGEIFDSVTISEQVNHHSFAKIEDNWIWTPTPTPGGTNQFTQSTNTTSNNGNDEIPEVSLQDIYSQNHNSKLMTEGIVIRESNLNAKYVYISNGEDIIKVYSTKKELNSLKKGQHIKVSGTWFSNENNTYLRIKSFAEDVVILNQAKVPNHIILTTSDLATVPLFHNVTITGSVDNQSENTWNLITPSNAIKIELAKGLNLEKPEFTKGDTMTVTGFVDIERGVRRVIVSSISQISITPQENISDSNPDEENQINISEENPSSPQNQSLSSLIQATITQTIPQGFAFFKPFISNPYVLGLITIGGLGIVGFILKDFIKNPK